MSFRVERTGSFFRAEFPVSAWPAEQVERALARLPATVGSTLRRGTGETQILELDPVEAHEACNLFARINGYPEFPPGILEGFRNHASPLVSCILLLPFNDLFARHVVLPSIIHHSRSHSIEIIVVFAGFGIDRRPFARLGQLESELTSIAKGYNLGVRYARGEYVALFHDDCFVEDPEWIGKALDALQNGATAVTPEFDSWRNVPVAKAVPLVMRRRDYERLGGYDQYYFAGVEDMDLTVSILAGGGEVRQLDIRSRHLRGMGTSLIVHEEPHQLKLLYGYQVLPEKVIAQVHMTMMQRLLENGWIRMLEGDYHLRFLEKHGEFLSSRFNVDVAGLTEVYGLMRYPFLLTPMMAYRSDRQKLVEAYRSLMNVADLERPLEGGERRP